MGAVGDAAGARGGGAVGAVADAGGGDLGRVDPGDSEVILGHPRATERLGKGVRTSKHCEKWRERERRRRRRRRRRGECVGSEMEEREREMETGEET